LSFTATNALATAQLYILDMLALDVRNITCGLAGFNPSFLWEQRAQCYPTRCPVE
jgi:hypothetical protein